ncbi:MAG: GFA family protein [Lysobacterales bacterium]|jgi:hypothetical protein
MSGHAVTGSCLCGKVRYELKDNLGVFQYCHCSRCRKFTGGAFAANIFVAPGDLNWLDGEKLVGRYDPEHTKYFATAFCKNCGSSLPWLSKSGRVIVVPAGTLDEDPGIRPDKNIFCASRAEWYASVESLPQHDEGPPR